MSTQKRSPARLAEARARDAAERGPAPSLADHAFNWLAMRIVNGALQPGELLSEVALVGQIGVSRTPVREALRRLEHDGLVRIVPGRGAYVATFSEREVREIYQCRMELEGLAARLAAERMTPEALAQFRELTDELGRALTAGDHAAFFRANVRFTNLKYQVANNLVLQQLLESLGLRVMRLRFLSMGLPARMEISYRLHLDLLSAFERRDGEAADRITQELISGAGLAILRYHFGVSENEGRTSAAEDIADVWWTPMARRDEPSASAGSVSGPAEPVRR